MTEPMKINLRKKYTEIKNSNPMMSLDELLYKVYNEVKKEDDNFEQYKNIILEANDMDELNYYTKEVREDLKKYIEKTYFLNMN